MLQCCAANGTTPPLTLTRAGVGQITLGDLALNLRLLDSSGAPIDVSPKTDGDQNKDGDPFTFEVMEAFRDREAFDLHQARTRESDWFMATRGILRDFRVEEVGD